MRSAKLVPAMILVIAAGFYVYTACPSVYVGDTGEIVAAANSLGIAHPPGYPLYTTLGYLFTKLPLYTIAHRVNLLAGFLFALSAALFYLFLKKIAKTGFSFILGTAASLVLAFSSTYWSQSVMAKGGIYGLNLVFILFSAIMLFRVLEQKDKKAFLWLAFLGGLAMANHHTFLAILALNLFLVFLWQRKLFFDNFFKILLLVVLGCCYYLYLPIRAHFNPDMNWGNPVTLRGMFDVLTRSQYGAMARDTREFGTYIAQVGTFFSSFFIQFTPWLLVFFIFGVWKLFQTNKRTMLYISAIFIIFSFYMVYLGSPKLTRNDLDVIEVFYIPAYMSAAIFIYFGLKNTAELIKLKPLQVLLSLVFILPLLMNFNFNNRRANFIPRDYGINMLKTPEKDSILFASQDNEVFVLAYFKKVEKVRPDVTVYEDLGCVFDNIYGEDMLRVDMRQHEKKRYDAQMKIVKETKRPVYYLRTASMFKWMQGNEKQAGIMFTLKEPPKKDYFKGYSFAGIEDPLVYKEYLVRDIAAQYYFSMAEDYLNKKQEKSAFDMFDKATTIADDIPWVNNNIGIVLQNKGLTDLAIENYKKSIAANPRSYIARYNLGLCYVKKNMLGEAETEYKEAIKLKPDYADALNNLGTLYLRLNRFPEAKALLLKGVELNPTSTAYYNLGVVLNELMEYDNAITSFNNAIVLNPGNYEAYNNKAFAYYYKQDIGKAIEACEMAVKIKPDFEEAKANLQRLKAMNHR